MNAYKFVGLITYFYFQIITAQEFSRHDKGLLFNLLLNKCNCRCGVANRQGRILGGEIIKQYEFPWLAYIRIKDKEIIHATLINDRYVITSAGLLAGLTPFDMKVLLSLQDRCTPDISSTVYSVNSIIVHQLYNSLDRVHDVALVKINNAIDFEKRVSPICLPTTGRTYLGEVATLIGWTKDDKQDTLSNCRPLKLGLPVLGLKECLATSPDKTFFTGDKRCIGVVGAFSAICKDDAGGPVMYRDRDGLYELIGILSDKNTCGNPPSTAMYTSLQEHMEWLKQNTRDACYCLKL